MGGGRGWRQQKAHRHVDDSDKLHLTSEHSKVAYFSII